MCVGLTPEQILHCCAEGYRLGFRTFVLQGGEGVLSLEKICSITAKIRAEYPDCAITLSLGEYEATDYLKMYRAGANRYLLRPYAMPARFKSNWLSGWVRVYGWLPVPNGSLPCQRS